MHDASADATSGGGRLRLESGERNENAEEKTGEPVEAADRGTVHQMVGVAGVPTS